MVTSNSITSYDDCFKWMAAALDDEKGARIECEDHGKARNLQLRINKARYLHRQQNARIYDKEDPMHGRSEYDGLIFRVKSVGEKWYVYLEIQAAREDGFELLSQVDNDDGQESE